MYYAKGDNRGPWDLDVEYWVKELGFSKTQAVVLDLISELKARTPGGGDEDYIIWLDNLFISVKLLS